MPGELRPNQKFTLGDLLDRLLDKGMWLGADVIIGVAGIPLVGLNLRLLAAGMSTMLQYGLMTDWDAAIRAWERDDRRSKKQAVDLNEPVRWSGIGTIQIGDIGEGCVRTGKIVLTDTRMMLVDERSEQALECPYQGIEAVRFTSAPVSGAPETARLQIDRSGMDSWWVYVATPASLAGYLDQATGIPVIREDGVRFSDTWFRVQFQQMTANRGVWKDGRIRIRGHVLEWLPAAATRAAVRLPFVDIARTELVLGNPTNRQALLTVFQGGTNLAPPPRFCGRSEVMAYWDQLIQNVKQGTQNLESCPRCGYYDVEDTLLNVGCAFCGWTSYRQGRASTR